jgi:hypothetical protein
VSTRSPGTSSIASARSQISEARGDTPTLELCPPSALWSAPPGGEMDGPSRQPIAVSAGNGGIVYAGCRTHPGRYEKGRSRTTPKPPLNCFNLVGLTMVGLTMVGLTGFEPATT